MPVAAEMHDGRRGPHLEATMAQSYRRSRGMAAAGWRLAAWLGFGLAAAAGPGGTAAQSAATPTREAPSTRPLAPADRVFASDAARGLRAMVAMAQVAQRQAAGAPVRAWAERLQADHTRALDELATLAAATGLQLPARPADPDRVELDRLGALHDGAFDRAFVSRLVERHRREAERHARASSGVADTSLKAWAQRTLVVLREHLEVGQTVESTLATGDPTPQTPASAPAPGTLQARPPGR